MRNHRDTFCIHNYLTRARETTDVWWCLQHSFPPRVRPSLSLPFSISISRARKTNIYLKILDTPLHIVVHSKIWDCDYDCSSLLLLRGGEGTAPVEVGKTTQQQVSSCHIFWWWFWRLRQYRCSSFITSCCIKSELRLSVFVSRLCEGSTFVSRMWTQMMFKREH